MFIKNHPYLLKTGRNLGGHLNPPPGQMWKYFYLGQARVEDIVTLCAFVVNRGLRYSNPSLKPTAVVQVYECGAMAYSRCYNAVTCATLCAMVQLLSTLTTSILYENQGCLLCNNLHMHAQYCVMMLFSGTQ